MAGRQQLERILRIDQLIRSGQYPSPDQLAEDLEVSRRVIFFDRQFMIDRLHAPIKFDRRRGGWYYTDATWMLPSTMVTEGELLAFLLATEVALQSVGSDLQVPLLSAVEKISQSLQGPVQIDLESLRAHCSFARPVGLSVQPALLAQVLTALREQQSLQIEYHGADRNQRTRRIINPYELRHVGGDWHLLAFDHLRQAMRTFNLGRVKVSELLAQRFERDPEFNAEEWRRSLFLGESGDGLMDVAVRFEANQAVFMRERQWHETQTIEELPDGGIVLRFQTGSWGEVVRWIMQYGSHAIVLEPEELREEITCEVQRMAAYYPVGTVSRRYPADFDTVELGPFLDEDEA